MEMCESPEVAISKGDDGLELDIEFERHRTLSVTAA